MQLREQIERSAKEARDKAFAQAREEHERVMDEAAAQVEQMRHQHEEALAAALAQKDAQLGRRLVEHEGQLAPARWLRVGGSRVERPTRSVARLWHGRRMAVAWPWLLVSPGDSAVLVGLWSLYSVDGGII